MTDEVKRVGVVGLGVMGFDIAFLCAMKGYRTLAYDASSPVRESFAGRMEASVERLKRRNRISENQVQNVRKGLTVSESLEDMAGLHLIVEAVSESMDTKLSVYRALSKTGFDGILTSNTSSIPRKVLLDGGGYNRQKFASTHFFNPVLYTRMVEVVFGDMDQSATGATLSFLQSMDRNPVETRDISGFVSNSVLMYYAVMALRLLECGGRIEQIDETAKQMGLLPPFISFDSWKPSIVEDVTRVMFENRGDEFLRSSKLLPVLAGKNPRFYLEQKPNQEIYEFRAEGQRASVEHIVTIALKASIHIAAARVVELGEDPRNVDFICVEGLKIPRAPLEEIDEIGPRVLLEELDRINSELPQAKLAPPKILAAMASERGSFYNNGQPSSWITSFRHREESYADH